MEGRNVERAHPGKENNMSTGRELLPRMAHQRDAHSGKHSKERWGWECMEWPKWQLQFPCFGEFVC